MRIRITSLEILRITFYLHWRRSRCATGCGIPPAADVPPCPSSCGGCARECASELHLWRFCGSLLTSTGAGLADLLAQDFAGITDTLVLIRIGLAQRPDVSRHLAQQLTIVARQNQVSLFIDLQIHAVRQQQFDGVGVAQRENRDAPSDVGAVTDADDIEFPNEPGRDALNRIGGEGARETM